MNHDGVDAEEKIDRLAMQIAAYIVNTNPCGIQTLAV